MNHPKAAMPKGKKKKKFITGELILCSLICIMGLLALSKIMLSSTTDLSPTVYTPPHTNTSPKATRLSLLKEPVIEHVEKLEITGYYDAGEKLSFHIPDYHRKISYELELGNGKFIAADKAIITYAYPEDGRYRVKLWGTCNGQRKLLRTKRIKIEAAIEVSEDAFVEVD